MPRYEQLQEEQRDKRRTIADVIDVLYAQGVVGAAKIRVGALRLPSDEIVGLVNAFVESTADDTIFVVSLPTSGHFRAQTQGGAEVETLEIFQLDEATVDGAGVELADGARLRGVEVIPSLLPYHVTDLDWRIVHHTIAYLRAESECYRYPIHFERRRDALDCSALAALRDRIPLLKQVQWYIAGRDPTLKRLSEQKIADTLRKFGMRIPAPRTASRRMIPGANN